jgi:pyoverdine/dityrosine biosynthesis protein Dit1
MVLAITVRIHTRIRYVHVMNAYGFQLDLTGVTDKNLWEYATTLRQMVNEKGYDKCIDFIRIMNLLGIYNHSTITQEKFISLIGPSRKELMERYGDPNFDPNACIKNNPDYKMTYDGYAKFLKKDLAYGAIRDPMISGKKYKAMVHESAKAMIARGVVNYIVLQTLLYTRPRPLANTKLFKAFANLIMEKCPEHVRLSIHPSTGQTKISMPLIPQTDSFSMTPWHCAVAVDTQGNFKTAHVGVLNATHDKVFKHGRPYHYRERSALWNWDAKVEFEHLYGGGLVIHNIRGDEQCKDLLSKSDKLKLASLAIAQGKVELRGFM